MSRTSVPATLAVILACCVVAVLLFRQPSISDQAARDIVVALPAEDAGMAAAMAEARRDLGGFLERARSPLAGQRGFAVKVGFRTTGGGPEYVWLTPFSQQEGSFRGTVANAPQSVPGLRSGAVVTFQETQIVDWMFIDAGGAMRGNRTTCVLLARESPDAVAEFSRRFGLDCTRNGL